MGLPGPERKVDAHCEGKMIVVLPVSIVLLARHIRINIAKELQRQESGAPTPPRATRRFYSLQNGSLLTSLKFHKKNLCVYVRVYVYVDLCECLCTIVYVCV